MERFEKILTGDVRTASRLIRDLEDGFPEAIGVIKSLYPYTGHAHVVGITGPPGAGKSTLTDGLIAAMRQQDMNIGVLAVDPTSPFTGGAILGDRVRMQRHTEDPEVFIRSLATRGALGGLSRAAGDSLHVMDSMGKDIILVETVGTGQQEVDIMDHAHTVIVVLVPGMGDAVQAIKAGVMEIADVFVINKADRDGADVLCNEINMMLDMAGRSAKTWRPPVVKIGNIMEQAGFTKGIGELADKILAHHHCLAAFGGLGERKRRQALCEIKEALKANILGPVYDKLVQQNLIEEMVNKIVTRKSDAHSLSEEIAQQYLRKL
jgi:LAO/AO transport system kinase